MSSRIEQLSQELVEKLEIISNGDRKEEDEESRNRKNCNSFANIFVMCTVRSFIELDYIELCSLL